MKTETYCIDFHYHISCVILRLLVECRYLPSPVLSVSYLVKTPTLGPAVQTQGVFGVQLRIAKGTKTLCVCVSGLKFMPVEMDGNS